MRPDDSHMKRMRQRIASLAVAAVLLPGAVPGPMLAPGAGLWGVAAPISGFSGAGPGIAGWGRIGSAAAQEMPVPPAERGDHDEGLSLIERGMKLLFEQLLSEMEPAFEDMGEALRQMEPILRSLAGLITDVENYEPPERLPNGDVIIRRKPGAPPPPPLPAPDAAPIPPPQIEL